MNPSLYLVIGSIAGLAVGAILAWWLTARQRSTFAHERQSWQQRSDSERQSERQRLQSEAQAAAALHIASERETLAKGFEEDRRRLGDRESKLDQREATLGSREAALGNRETALSSRETGVVSRDAKIVERETAIDRRLEAVDRRDADLRGRESILERRDEDLANAETALEARRAELNSALERIAGLNAEQAKAELLERFDADLGEEKAKRLSRHEKDVTTRAKELGIEAVARAVQRYAAEHTADTTTSRVAVKEEEFKGRIIGKEGRNIKAFEQATGVDLIVDETPGFITISCFSGLRREIARRTLEILLEDGRIHPGRIEEVLLKVQTDIDREVLRLGEDAAFACDVSGLHPQLLKLLGKLQWRTSYGQNVLKHTQEVAFLCGAMAADLGLDPRLGRRCGLMHDIGKAIDHDQEGSHPVLGYEALKRYNETEIVANAALAHHEGHEVLTAYTVLAAAADAISAARPGARRENTEKYLKRLSLLEEIACTFPGVQKAYAIQAGRELRVIVNGTALADSAMSTIAHDIARRIEGEVTYPGEVRVTLIREMRSFAVAR